MTGTLAGYRLVAADADGTRVAAPGRDARAVRAGGDRPQRPLGLTLEQIAGGSWAALSVPTLAREVTAFRGAQSADPLVWRAQVQQSHFENGPYRWNRWLRLRDVGLMLSWSTTGAQPRRIADIASVVGSIPTGT